MIDKPLVRVTWLDAHASSTTAYAEHEIPHAAIEIVTVGWLLKQDVEGVSVANEYCNDSTYRGYTYIPSVLVKKVENLEKVKRVRKPKPPPTIE